MHLLIYNIICILTILFFTHTYLFLSEKVQEVKFIKVFLYLLKS